MPAFKDKIGHQITTFLTFGGDPELFPRALMIAVVPRN